MIRCDKLSVVAGASVFAFTFSALSLVSPSVSADTSHSVGIGVTVPTTCSISVNTASHTASIDPGLQGSLGSSTVSTLCNDTDGFAIYAIGFSNNTLGDNTLISTVDSSNTIASNTASSPSASQWNMTLTAIAGDYAPTIMNQTTGDNPVGDFTQPHTVPTVYTKVAYRNSATGTGVNPDVTSFTASFNAYVDSGQTPGDYQGKVKFLLMHPNVTGASANNPTLQNVDTWASTVALGKTIEALDERDGQVYKVTRYKMNADGTETALWMSNLNLGAEPLLVTELNSTNTHLDTGVSPISASTFNSWIKTSGTQSYTDPELIPITTSNSSNGLDTDSYGNKYGTLYNFAAASAGTYTYAGGAAPTGRDTTSDLCPAGWRLPTGRNNGEIKQLIIDGYNVVDVNNWEWNTDGLTTTESTLGFSRAGRFAGGAPVTQGSSGRYWSSTWADALSMYDLEFSSSVVYPYVAAGRRGGCSVRCIKQPPLHTLTISTGTGVDTVTIDGTTYHNGDTVDLEERSTHRINMTFQSGYEFDSWSVSGTGTSVTSASTQSTTLTMGTTNSTLTANGKKLYLQDWNGCSSMAVGDKITLYDNRDEQAYTVTKYYMDSNHTAANAKCWMSNLNLGDTTNYPLVVSQLDSTNSNMPTASAIPAATFNSWIKSYGTSSYTSPELIPVTASNSITGSDTDSYGNKYGTLYNYAAASANSINTVENYDDATNSLCPYGWRLPTGTLAGEFKALYDAYSVTNDSSGSIAMQSNYGFSLAGYVPGIINSSPVDGQGYLGNYWSSSHFAKGAHMSAMEITTSRVEPHVEGDTYRRDSYSVRCVRTQ